MLRKSQATADIVISLPLLNKDGSQAVGLSLGTLSTKIIKPDGTALTGYTEAAFTEPNSDGVYTCTFLAVALTKAFTLVDQPNPYTLTLDSSTVDVEPTTIEVSIVSVYPWEVAKETTLTTVSNNVDSILADVANILGLSKHNFVEDDIVRDGSGNKTQSVFYLYDSAANASTHDGTTGIVDKYTVSATYSSGRLVRWKSIKQ